MKAGKILMLFLFFGCSEGDPVRPGEPVYVGPVVVQGTAFGGDGHGLRSLPIRIELLRLGCEGSALSTLSSKTGPTGVFSTTFPRGTFPERLCVRVTSDAWAGFDWDNNVVVQDAASSSQPINVVIRYDWARLILSTYIPPADSVRVKPHAFKFSIQDGAAPLDITGDTLQSGSGWRRDSGPIPTATVGELRVRVGFSDAIGTAAGVADFQLEPDRILNLTASVGSKNPWIGCFRCAKVMSFPLMLDGIVASDSLFVVFTRIPASHVPPY